MNSSSQQKPAPRETEKYEAFDRVTEALKYLAEYNSHEEKDEQWLEKADGNLTLALEIDGDYFKAKYLQAMVKYLRGQWEDEGKQKGAISLFEGLLNEATAEPLAKEIRYNLAAAYSERHGSESWQTAINYFHDAIRLNKKTSTSYDPELDLLAHAGLFKTYTSRKKASERSDKKDARQVREDSGAVQSEYKEIQKILRPGFLRRMLQLLRMQKSINWRVADKVEEIIVAEGGKSLGKPRGPRRGLVARAKRILPTAAIILAILLVFTAIVAVVVSIYLYRAVRLP